MDKFKNIDGGRNGGKRYHCAIRKTKMFSITVIDGNKALGSL